MPLALPALDLGAFGLTVANVVGVPLGTFVGQSAGRAALSAAGSLAVNRYRCSTRLRAA